MRRAPLARAAVVTAVILLTACAAGGIPKHESDAQARERYAAYAGPPIDHITWLGRYDSWEPLGRDQLVVFTNFNEAYLLKVTGACTDLPFATHIGLTSTGSTVYARLDSVVVGRWRCAIAEIRKVDYKRMRADMRTEAAKAKAGG